MRQSPLELGRVLRWLIRVSVLAVTLVTPAMHAQSGPTTALSTVEVKRETAPLERLYDGTVEAVNQATVSAQTSGRVAEIFYDVNDYVEGGAAIIRFTEVEQQAALRQAEAALREANARQREANVEYERTSALYEAGSSSRREYDAALSSREAARARVKAAQSAIEAASQQVEYTLVRAPYSGIVTRRHVEVGESVTVGQALMSGLSLEQLRVVVDLPQDVMTRVRGHLSADVLTAEGRVTAERVTIFPFADSATNTFRVRVELPIGRFGLYPGMFVKVAFVVGEAERLLIPSAALIRRSEVTACYVVGETVRLRQVRVGNAFGDRVEVLAGLTEGERVAIDPVEAGIAVKSGAAGRHDH